MMKLPRALFFVGSAFGVVLPAYPAESYQPKNTGDAAQICVERFEDNGVVNIRAIDVIISDVTKLTLLGGYAGCVFVPTGKQTISLKFPFPYAGKDNVPYWTTPKRNFMGAKGEIVRFELCEDSATDANDPKWAETGWHSMWLLRLVGTKTTQHCAVEDMP
jgi:hypothetical protein